MTLVYFIYFQESSPLISLLPEGYRFGGAFADTRDCAALLTDREARGEKEAGTASSGETASSVKTASNVETDSGGDEREIAIINCLEYYRRVSALKKESDAILLRSLVSLREAEKDLGIRVILPERKNADQDFLIEIMSAGFLNFWFLENLNRSLFLEILETDRDFRAMESYLNTLPIPAEAKARKDPDGRFSGLGRLSGIGALSGIDKLSGIGALSAFLSEKISPKPEEKFFGRLAENSASIQPDRWEIPEKSEGRDGYDDYAIDFGLLTKSVTGAIARLRSYAGGSGAGSSDAEIADVDRAGIERLGITRMETSYIEDPGERDPLAAAPFEAPREALRELPREEPFEAPFKSAYEERVAERDIPLSPGAPEAEGVKPSGIFAACLRRVKTRRARPDIPMPAGATVLFHSEDDSVMPYALAFMTAVQTALSDRKTLLIELPGCGSRLAETLGLRHPGRNLSEAIRAYADEGLCHWERFCFNGPAYLRDPESLDAVARHKSMPDQLYILPDNHAGEKLFPHWDGFAASLIHWAILEARFTFIIYAGFGRSEGAVWKKSLLCGNKIITYAPLPRGFNEAALSGAKWPSGSVPAFDGSWGDSYIRREIKTMRLKEYFIIPRAVKEDFIRIASFERDCASISADSAACLREISASLARRDA